MQSAKIKRFTDWGERNCTVPFRLGSPLADQLRRQAASLRRDQRRAVEERAARAAPKIQLVVALVLVPSVLLMIAAALIANADVLLSGF